MPWYRVWTDILDSEKFAELDDATIGGWTLILSAVKRFDQGGLLPPDKKLCHWTRRPKATVIRWIERLLEAGLLEGGSDGVHVHDWDRWQEPKDRTNAQRQAKFKAAKKALSALSQETPETDNRERAEETVTAAPLPAGDNGPVTALPRSLPSSTSLRSGEDADQFNAALQLLDGSLITEGVAMELRRRASLSEIRSIEGWRWLNAARVMGKGAKAYTVEWLHGIAKGTTRQEFDAYGKAPAGKFGKPEPGPTNQPPPRIDHATPEAKAKHEECVAKYKELESRNGRLPAV